MIKQNAVNFLGSFIRLIYPRICPGCNNDLYQYEAFMCLHCQRAMVYTDMVDIHENAMFGMFRPFLEVQNAAAAYYYGRDLIIQRLMYEIKYGGNRKLGEHIGACLGNYLNAKPGWGNIDYLIPVPLHKRKQAIRGFNQSELICRGMSSVLGIPMLSNVLFRKHQTSTQTRRSRTERWENVSSAFELHTAHVLESKHLLLVDDVVTTGATLLSCAMQLSTIPGIRLSIASVAYSGDL